MHILELEKLRGVRLQTHNGATWIDITSPDTAVVNHLETHYGLNPVQLQESQQKVQLSTLEHEKEYKFILLPVPYYDKKRHKIRTGQVGVFLGKDFLVTIHDADVKVSGEVFTECLRDSRKRDDYFKKGAGGVLYHLVRRLLEEVTILEQTVLRELDDLEDNVFGDSGSDALPIGRLRQKITRLRRVMVPLCGMLDDLAEGINTFTGQSLVHHYENNTKMATRLAEIIEESKETIEIFKDADFTISTEKTNETLAILTLLFTLTIPATVVGSIYGMNIMLPGGLEAGSWDFLGKFTMFKLIIGSSVLSAVLMFAYFRRKKWF